MKDKENHEQNEGGKQIKLQISIPFQWEEEPGAPKKDWKPKCSCEPVIHHVPLSVKYVASIPFKWEEKPGTPLRTFARDPTNPKNEEMELENKSLPLPPGYFSKFENESDDESSYNHDYDYDDQDLISELEFEALSVKSEDSFYSNPSLLANRVSPLWDPCVKTESDGYEYDLFDAPESGEGQVNNGGGNESLKGGAFLDHLFPLYPPKSGFLNQGKSTEVPDRKPTFLEEHQKFIGYDRQRGVIRRPCTLGELIMQSRRRSFRRKAVHLKKYNQHKSFAENKPQGCFDVVASGGGLAKMLRKNFLALKLT